MSFWHSCVYVWTFVSITLLTFYGPLGRANVALMPKNPILPSKIKSALPNSDNNKLFPIHELFDMENYKKLKELMDLKPTLPTLNIDIDQTSTSGPSSGGYMANQFHIAYSSHVIGSAMFSSGPYLCSKGSIFRSLNDCTLDGTPKAQNSIDSIHLYYQVGIIDNPENLKDDKVFIFTGSKDTVVHTSIPDALYEQHKAFLPEENIKYIRDEIPAGHGIVSKHTGSECGVQNAEFINKCDYDAPGELLKHIYGTLNPPTRPIGKLMSFSQMGFIGDRKTTSLAPLGFVYIPSGCLKGDLCKTHIVFHGCMQTYIHIHDSFYGNGKLGYNEWAESNNIVVPYPQLKPGQLFPLNPLACWDWWGYSSLQFYSKSAPQMKTIFSMLQKLAGISDKDEEEGEK